MSWPCDKLEVFLGEVRAGTVANSELRPRVKEIDDAAAIGTPEMQAATAEMLVALTAVDNGSTSDQVVLDYRAGLDRAVAECNRFNSASN